LLAAGIATTKPAEVLAHPNLGQACEPVVARARSHFAQAHAIMKNAPRQTVRTPRIMYEAYRTILDRLARRGWEPPRERVRIGKLHLVGILLRAGLLR